MRYMLDSNIIIALVTNGNEGVVRRAGECDEDEIVTSSIALTEVAFGSMRNKPPGIEQLRAFVEEVPVLAFDYKAALAYSSLPFKRASYDRLIAAHALSHELTIVTHDVGHFADIVGLKVENWMS